jgi:ketosteroid isomerase-like protein
MMASVSNEALQQLLDKQEIHEVIMRYCRGIDRLDREMIRSVYHDDAIDEHGLWKGGPDEFVAYVVPVLEKETATTHLICNELVEVEGDVAYAESYFLAVHRRPHKEGGQMHYQFCGRYIDRFERRKGVWKIAHRSVVHSWSRKEHLMEQFPGADQAPQGIRSKEDLIYKRA